MSHTLGPQLWINRHPPRASSFNVVVNDHGFRVKPQGGLWTSTYSDEIGSGWVEWCLAEDFRVPQHFRWHGWLLTPPWDARVYEIDSYADLRRLAESEFGMPEGPGYFPAFGGCGIDFEKMSQSYDAIHLTEAGQWATRLSHPHTLYGWDCESTLWLHYPWAWAEIHEVHGTWGQPKPISTRGRIRRARRSDF